VGGQQELPWNFHGPDHTDPISFLRSFCADYTTWNNVAMAVSGGLTAEKKLIALEEASEAYARLLAPFIAPETKPQLISYGTDSFFDPSRLRLENMEETSTGWNVRFSIKHSILEFEDDYSAEVERSSDGKLVLRQIWYLDPFPEAGQERLAFL
jgi:hypothetical protein